MEVFRITKVQYADRLVASGGAARWNARGRFVIYTAATRALACLENVVHRSGEGLQETFRVMVIQLPDTVRMDTISPDTLPPDWFAYTNYAQCQQLGEDWLQRGQAAVLRVPSAIIPQEWNFLINPMHPDFSSIRLIKIEPFAFDPRIKTNE